MALNFLPSSFFLLLAAHMGTTTPALWRPGAQTQAFVQARQAPYKLSHILQVRAPGVLGVAVLIFQMRRLDGRRAVWYPPTPSSGALPSVPCPPPVPLAIYLLP